MSPPKKTLKKNRRERTVILNGAEVSFGISEDEVYAPRSHQGREGPGQMTKPQKKQVAKKKKQKAQKKAMEKNMKASKKKPDLVESAVELGSDDQDLGESLMAGVTHLGDFDPSELEAWKGKGISGTEETHLDSLSFSELDAVEGLSANEEAHLDALRLSEFDILSNSTKDYDNVLNTLENFNETEASTIGPDTAENDVEGTHELHHAHGRSTPDKADKSLLVVCKEISAHGDAIGISKSVSDIAKYLFKIANNAKALKGASQDAIIAGCIFIACRQCEVHRTFREIYALTKVPEKDIARSFQALEKFFAKDRDVKLVPGGLSAAFLQWKEGDTSEKLDDLLKAKFANPYSRPCVLVTFIKANRSGLPEIMKTRFSSSGIRAAFLISTVKGKRVSPEAIFGPPHLGPRTRACVLKYPHLHVGEAVHEPITEIDDWLEYLLPDGTKNEVYRTKRQNRVPSTSAQESKYQKPSVEDEESKVNNQFTKHFSPTDSTSQSPEHVPISPRYKPVSPTFNSPTSPIYHTSSPSPTSPVFQPQIHSGISNARPPMPQRQRIPQEPHRSQIQGPYGSQMSNMQSAQLFPWVPPAEYPGLSQYHQTHQAYLQNPQGDGLSSTFSSSSFPYPIIAGYAPTSASSRSNYVHQTFNGFDSSGSFGSGSFQDFLASGEGWSRQKRKRPTAAEVTDEAEARLENSKRAKSGSYVGLNQKRKPDFNKVTDGTIEGQILANGIQETGFKFTLNQERRFSEAEDFIGLDVAWPNQDEMKPKKRKQKAEKNRGKIVKQKKKKHKRVKAKNSKKGFSGYGFEV